MDCEEEVEDDDDDATGATAKGSCNIDELEFDGMTGFVGTIAADEDDIFFG